MDEPGQATAGMTRQERAGAWMLLVCLLVVAVWETAAFLNRRPHRPFSTTAQDYELFNPVMPDAEVRRIPVASNPTEPNLVALLVSPRQPDGGLLLLGRLVHGYNMVDCMRIKGYRVDLVHDLPTDPGPSGPEEGASLVQVWRLTAETGERSLWMTSLHRGRNLEPVRRDVRSMAFPRIDIPDDPDWTPDGITWSSLRHPVAGLRRYVRAKWNASRNDPWVFIGLKKAPWASDEWFTLVTHTLGNDLRPDQEAESLEQVRHLHQWMAASLRDWHRRTQGEP